MQMDSERVIEARKRLCWIAAARAVLCLFAAAIISLNVELKGPAAHLAPYIVVAAVFVLNAAYLALAYSPASWRVVAGTGTVMDVAAVTALVVFTGGAASDFRLLYFGPILAAAVLFSRSATLLVAALSTMGLFSAVAVQVFADAQLRALIGGAWAAPALVDNVVGTLALQAVGFHLVAYLAATLTLRLRSASIDTEHILQNMSDGVITVARDGRVVFANSRAREMLALDRSKPLKIGRAHV
jgi:PAS domain-containing protein